mmetsp:Transcript_2778/g.4019  ORF Transcript_2778/g.4019 Transcript_2778/m.4019 type:complete len:82 (+) Transcript_2778:237-482(+)
MQGPRMRRANPIKGTMTTQRTMSQCEDWRSDTWKMGFDDDFRAFLSPQPKQSVRGMTPSNLASNANDTHILELELSRCLKS